MNGGGNIFGQLDWNSEHYHKNEHPELGAIATKLRPRFYTKLLRYKIPFDQQFSKRIYETLKSYGQGVQLETKELMQVCQIFQSMSDDILTELSSTS